MVRKVLALGAAAAIAAGLAACGGDDGDDTSATDTEAISQADWVAQANQICADGNKEIEQAAPDGNDIEGFVTDTFVPGIQSQIDAIRALGAPEGMEDQITDFLDGAEDDLDAVEQDPSSLGNDSFKETNQEAAELGLDECAG